MKKTYRAAASDSRKGGKKFEKDSSWGRSAGGRGSAPALFKATCSKCGKPCEVPFRPTGGRSVLCSDCFKRDGDGPQKRFGAKREGGSNFGEKRSFSSFKREPRPYAEKNSDDINEQFKILNAKLDEILKALK